MSSRKKVRVGVPEGKERETRFGWERESREESMEKGWRLGTLGWG